MTHATARRTVRNRYECLPERRLARVPADALFLERLLNLPPDHHISHVAWDAERQLAVFVIEGSTMPRCRLGSVIEQIRPAVRVDLDTSNAQVIEWPTHV